MATPPHDPIDGLIQGDFDKINALLACLLPAVFAEIAESKNVTKNIAILAAPAALPASCG